MTELPQIFRTDVGKFVMFQVRPDVFDRVQFGGVSRQAFDVNSSAQTADIFGDDLATVGRKPIPHNEEFAGYVPNQMLEEDNHMPAADRFLEQLKVEVPQRSPGNDRQRLPVEVVLEDGCLATRRPSPTSMLSLA